MVRLGEMFGLEGLDIRSKQLEADDWHLAHSKAVLTSCYAELGRFDESESLLLPA